MKILSTLLVAGSFAMGLCACNNDDLTKDENAPQTDESVYMKVRIQFSTGSPTRSTTDDEGDSNSDADPEIEVGQEYENKITSLQLLLTDENANPIAYSLSEDGNNPNDGQTFCVKFLSKDLVANANTDVNAYVFCNPYAGIDYTDPHAVFTMTTDPAAIWKDDHFFMTSAERHTFHLPLRDSLYQYVTPDHAYDITENNPIPVERTAARLDYAAKDPADQTFTFKDYSVQLTDMALFNLSKSCYNLRRVSGDGTMKNAEICGKEIQANYVVDTDHANKSVDNLLYTNVDSLSWTSIESLNVEDSIHTSSGPEYYIWRYVIENTFPKNALQTKKVATGVVFKGVLAAGKGAPASIINAITAGEEALYVFDNNLYGTWERLDSLVRLAADPDINLQHAYNATLSESDTISIVERARKHGFTVYEPVGDKYYMFYYYWNRHNDNNNLLLSGPMEFAVVRNNVYKLRVKQITGFGDDVFELPDGPVEETEVYFQVGVNVLPWVVRVNDIEF